MQWCLPVPSPSKGTQPRNAKGPDCSNPCETLRGLVAACSHAAKFLRMALRLGQIVGDQPYQGIPPGMSPVEFSFAHTYANTFTKHLQGTEDGKRASVWLHERARTMEASDSSCRLISMPTMRELQRLQPNGLHGPHLRLLHVVLLFLLQLHGVVPRVGCHSVYLPRIQRWLAYCMVVRA